MQSSLRRRARPPLGLDVSASALKSGPVGVSQRSGDEQRLSPRFGAFVPDGVY